MTFLQFLPSLYTPSTLQVLRLQSEKQTTFHGCINHPPSESKSEHVKGAAKDLNAPQGEAGRQGERGKYEAIVDAAFPYKNRRQ